MAPSVETTERSFSDIQEPLDQGTGGAAVEVPVRRLSKIDDAPTIIVAEGTKLCKMGCGLPVMPGVTRKGNKFDTCCRSCVINPGLGCHDPTCGGATPVKPLRPGCAKGSRCRNRSAEHLEAEAHPLDQDYVYSCQTGKPQVKPEPLSLKVIFDWADADGSGKLTQEELVDVIDVLKGICKDHLPSISEEAWKHLDEDGNGVLNFMEFASWAGPRLGLPLGMAKMVHRTNSLRSSDNSPCGVVGCPCEAFDGADAGPSAKCKCCRHKRSLHEVRDISDSEVPFPDYWKHKDADSASKVQEILDLPEGALNEFQQVINRTHIGKWTRDRTRHNPTNPKVPSGFQVKSVRRNENSGSWREYGSRRAELLTRLTEEANDRPHLYDQVKSSVAYREIGGAKADRLATDCNEWYLFHGTSPDSAGAIMKSDFRVGCAGSNTGTLYGKGLYFAESITKADEYAKPDENGNYAVLFCRVLGGNVLYCDAEEPDPEQLVQNCISGPYDCVLGDREKIRGTYREFVLFDSEDVYAEYVIVYNRIYS